jgi:hypothetical protein
MFSSSASFLERLEITPTNLLRLMPQLKKGGEAAPKGDATTASQVSLIDVRQQAEV